jgi:DNA-binding MarR family transcriptional regulator
LSSDKTETARRPRERRVTLIALFRQTAQRMVGELVEALHDAGYTDISATHQAVFENLDPDGTRLTVLAARAGITHQSMGELVRELEQRGYLERIADPGDGRARIVRLTQRGRQVVRLAVATIAQIEARWTDSWRQAGFHGDVANGLRNALEQPERGTTATRQPHAGAPHALSRLPRS